MGENVVMTKPAGMLLITCVVKLSWAVVLVTSDSVTVPVMYPAKFVIVIPLTKLLYVVYAMGHVETDPDELVVVLNAFWAVTIYGRNVTIADVVLSTL